MDRVNKSEQRRWGDACGEYLAMASSPCSTCNCNSVTLLVEKRSVDYGGGGGVVLLNPKPKRGAAVALSVCQSRRSTALLISSLPFSIDWLSPPVGAARERRNKKNIPIDEYLTARQYISFYSLSHHSETYRVFKVIQKLYLVISLSFVMFDSADGLKYYDLVEGKGPVAEKGSTVQVC